ncbi:hypothetical protein GCM10007242_23730 [Pigmentiphaga litoralis]|uniref:lipopolysaccharide biosynthesis protein n=1 Tax=Pigmentiphaga litoralis TaxID=516702 RepID=UPI0016733CDF|nr:hypothetical protein [Pigmentiphaga litoralis]GGX16417.1 hypothetical protein GCM10007242_23730 [Pigmentiphaga litoralis]
MFSKLSAVAIRAVTLLLSVLSVTIIAPFLGITDLGRFALIQSIVMWTSLFGLGLIETCTGIINKFDQRKFLRGSKTYLDTSFLVVTAASAIVSVPLLVLALPWSWHSAATAELRPFATGIGLSLAAVPFSLTQGLLNARGEITRSMAWAFFTSALTVGSMLVVVRLVQVEQHQRLFAITLAYGLAMLLARASMHTLESYRAFGTITVRAKPSLRRLRLLSRSAYPFLLLNTAALAAFQIDRVVSFYFLSPEDTAKLDVAMKVIMAVYTLNTVFIAKLWHTVGNAWNVHDKGGARAVLKQSMLSTAAFWTVMGTAIIFTIDPIVYKLTGGAVELSDPYFIVAAVAFMAVRALVDSVTISIFATRNQHRTVGAVLTHGVLNVPLSIMGCILAGLPGIMIAQLLSLAITTGWRFPIIFRQLSREKM